MKYRWINDDIKIDFEVSKVIENTMREAEEADLAGDLGEYNGIVDGLDMLAKEAFVCRKITREQWDKIVNKYQMR